MCAPCVDSRAYNGGCGCPLVRILIAYKDRNSNTSSKPCAVRPHDLPGDHAAPPWTPRPRALPCGTHQGALAPLKPSRQAFAPDTTPKGAAVAPLETRPAGDRPDTPRKEAVGMAGSNKRQRGRMLSIRLTEAERLLDAPPKARQIRQHRSPPRKPAPGRSGDRHCRFKGGNHGGPGARPKAKLLSF